MPKNKQIAALCWRKRQNGLEVLLVTSRETKRWVIPKGWPMVGLKDHNAARREAFEEAGVEGRMQRAAIGTFKYDKRRADGAFRITVTVYALQVSRMLTSWPEKHERKRQWFVAEEAARMVQEPGLKRLLQAF